MRDRRPTTHAPRGGADTGPGAASASEIAILPGFDRAKVAALLAGPLDDHTAVVRAFRDSSRS